MITPKQTTHTLSVVLVPAANKNKPSRASQEKMKCLLSTERFKEFIAQSLVGMYKPASEATTGESTRANINKRTNDENKHIQHKISASELLCGRFVALKILAQQGY